MSLSSSWPYLAMVGGSLIFGAPPQSEPDEAAVPRTVAAGQPTATLHFRITDEQDQLIPARLTFLGSKGAGADLFGNPDADPTQLAVRRNVIYTLAGEARVTVPPDTYTIYASRGLEWSIDQTTVTLAAGDRATFNARLKREVDTAGWICGDFHLHTLTYSGHGDSNLRERIITFAGEGLEFAVATDHNHNTDYQPTIDELHAGAHMTAVTGNEVSVPIGHFNAFPLDPERPIPPEDADDANALFRIIREEINDYGVVPVIQVNHPRWEHIDYFRIAGFDPITARANLPTWSDDFDSVEVFNENVGWGYYDAETETTIDTRKSRYSVLKDWFNLLNRGHRGAAVGNSDSHTVYDNFAGIPRNYVRSSTDDPARIDVPEIARAIRQKQLFTTMGPFVEYWVNDQAMGSELSIAQPGAVQLRVRVQAASWIDCDRIKIIVNGDLVRELAVPQTRAVVRFDDRVAVTVARDSWLTILVEGDDDLAPIVAPRQRPIRPLAVANPVWVTVGTNRQWVSPWDQALARITAHPSGEWTRVSSGLGGNERGLTALAAAQSGHGQAAGWLSQALSDDDRVTRLLAARGADLWPASARHDADAVATLKHALLATAKVHAEDLHMLACTLRALRLFDHDTYRQMALANAVRHPRFATRYGGDVLVDVPATVARDWEILGYFDAVTQLIGPERNKSAETFVGKGGQPLSWRAAQTDDKGYLDLSMLKRSEDEHHNAYAYARMHVFSAETAATYAALGTDDGCRVWVGDTLVFEDDKNHVATPFAHFLKLNLQPGWNRVLFKVKNAKGGFGLYFRLFDDSVRVAALPAD